MASAVGKPRIRVPAGRAAISTMPTTVPEVETRYHAASMWAKDMASWAPWRLSPDAALLPELDTIVARSDDLVRNNGIAAGAERTLVDNVVGPRVLAKPNPDRVALNRDAEWASDWSRKVESMWSSFADTVWFDAGLRLTFHSATRLVFRTYVSSGEALALPLWLTHAGSKWNTAIQLVDPARLSNPNNTFDNARLRGGIEIDNYGAAVAYNIRKAHPGDYFLWGQAYADANIWERIPAYMPWGRTRVLHFFEPDRIGVNRGKPLITAVARQFKMLDHYMREELRQAVLNSLIFAALETPLDQQGVAELFGGEGGGKDYIDALKEYRVQMKGGAMIPLPPGMKMTPFSPSRPSSAFDPFTTTMLRHIATGLNMPYELVAKDFSKTNYSSARAALLEAWRYFLACRQQLGDAWASPVYELWFEEAVNRGDIPDCTPADFYANRLAWTRCKWIMAGRGWVDPTKEAEAAAIRMSTNISTLEDECAEQGRDWRDVLEQLAREQQARKDLGLPDPAVAALKTNPITGKTAVSDNPAEPGDTLGQPPQQAAA